MAKYYEAESLLEFVKQNTPTIDGQTTMGCVERAIKEAPTAEVEEVKHGEWIKNKPNPEMMKLFHSKGKGIGMSEKSIFWTCSCCGNWGTLIHKRCSECGAKMDGGKA